MKGRERGFALLVVLWSLATLALIGTRLAASGHAAAASARDAADRAVMEQVADGAISDAIFDVLSGRSAADGVVRQRDVAGTPVALRLTDEDGRVNPNTAPASLLASLLLALGLPADRAESLALAIADWRDVGSRAIDGRSKLAIYRAAGLPYGPRNGPFRSTRELGLVLGMTPDVLALLAPHISVFTDGDLDRSAADDVVRTALTRAGSDFSGSAPQSGRLSRVVHIELWVRLRDGARLARAASVRISLAPDAQDPLYSLLDQSTNAAD